MAGFKELKDVCNNLEVELRNISKHLFAVKVGESFEDGVAKKMRDLTLFTSKLRLLQADPISRTPQVTATERDIHTTMSDYSDLATWKVIEQQTVKAVTQSHAVKSLISTPNSELEPEMIERKENIIHHLSEYSSAEYSLHQIETSLKEKEAELFELRQKWDTLLGELKDMREKASGRLIEDSGPLYVKLKQLIEKLELMRWLICKLVMSRNTSYDWLADPHKRLQALKLTRKPFDLDTFVQSS